MPTEAQIEAIREDYAAWCASRPPAVRAVAERFDPMEFYTLRDTGQTCHIIAFGEHEDGKITVRVYAWRESAPEATAVEVFGIDPDDLLPRKVPDAAQRGDEATQH